MRGGLLFILTAVLCAEQPKAPLDVVLLLDTTPGMQPILARTEIASLRPDDRAALMTFTKKARLRQAFTSDRERLTGVLRRSSVGGHGGIAFRQPQDNPEAHVFEALAAACRLFSSLPKDASRKRAIVVLFGDEDSTSKPTFEALKKMLLDASVSLWGVAVSKYDMTRRPDWTVQTPPTIPGPPGAPPVKSYRLPLPETTLKTIEKLAAATGGAATSGDWDLPAILGRIQGR